MLTYTARLQQAIEEADYEFTRLPDGSWCCHDILIVDEVVAEAATLGMAITEAAEALGVSL